MMKPTHRVIPLEARDEWVGALEGINHAFGHTWENCSAMHLTTKERSFLYCYEKNKIRIVCPIIERDYFGYTDIAKPAGFSGFVGNGFCPDFYKEWMTFVKERSYISGFLGLNPLHDFSSLFCPTEIYSHKNVYVIDIEPTLNEIYKGMSKGRREQCKRFEKQRENIISQEKAELKEFFINEYYNFLSRKGASPSSILSKKTLSFLIGLDNVILIGAKQSGYVVAVSLLAFTEKNGEFLLHTSLPEGQKFSAPIICQGIKCLKSLGVKNINLGGDTTEGIAAFKKRFGSKEIPLKCLKQIYRPDIYFELCRSAGANHEDFLGFFPAYRGSA